MLKRLRENRKSKKGFTLVELIVVIVIILVLAAVMVPSVVKYVEKSRQANVKSDAATLLVDLQAQIADKATDGGTIAVGETFKSNGVPIAVTAINATDTTTETAPSDADKASCSLSDEFEVMSFAYNNGSYTITWSVSGGWSEPASVS